MKIGVVVRRLIAIMIILCLCVIPVDTEKTNAADYPELSCISIDSEEDLRDIPEFAEPFLQVDGIDEDVTYIYMLNVEEMGSLFISNFDNGLLSFDIYVSQTSTFFKGIKNNTYSVYHHNIYGEVYKYESIHSYHLVPGTYYVKLVLHEESRVKGLLYSSFVKDSDLMSVNTISYNDDYSKAIVKLNLTEKETASGVQLYQGSPSQLMLNGELMEYKTVSLPYDGAGRYNLLVNQGFTITENGIYTVRHYISNSEFQGLYVAVSFVIDSIGGEILPEKVKLNNSTASLVKGEKVTLKATVTPSNAVDKSLTWKSSKKSVATVSKKGVVTAKGVGTCTITATTKNGKKAKCTITVTKKAAATPTPTPKPTAAPTPKPTASPTPAPVSNGFPYMATLDISSKGWTAYKPGTRYDMTGDAAGTIYQGAGVQVLEEKNGVAKVYSYDLQKECYISTKYLKKNEITPISDTSFTSDYTLEAGFYYIIPKCATSLCFDVQGSSTEDGAKVNLWSKYEELAKNQVYYVEQLADKTYTVSSLVSGMYLDIEGGKATSGARIVQKRYSNELSQRFILRASTNGYVSMISATDTSMCIDIDNAGQTNGTAIQILKRNDTAAQRFKFVKVESQANANNESATVDSKMLEAVNILKDIYGSNNIYFTTTGNNESTKHGSYADGNAECNLSNIVSGSVFKKVLSDKGYSNLYTELELTTYSHYPKLADNYGYSVGGYNCFAFGGFAQYFVYSYAFGAKDYSKTQCVYKNAESNYQVAYEVYGSKDTVGTHYSSFSDALDFVQIGDVLRLSPYEDGHYADKNGNTKGKWNHTSMVCGVDKANRIITVIDGNGNGDDLVKVRQLKVNSNGTVDWGTNNKEYYKVVAVTRPVM